MSEKFITASQLHIIALGVCEDKCANSISSLLTDITQAAEHGLFHLDVTKSRLPEGIQQILQSRGFNIYAIPTTHDRTSLNKDFKITW